MQSMNAKREYLNAVDVRNAYHDLVAALNRVGYRRAQPGSDWWITPEGATTTIEECARTAIIVPVEEDA